MTNLVSRIRIIRERNEKTRARRESHPQISALLAGGEGREGMGTMISNTGAAWSTAVTKWRRKFFHQVSVTGVFLLLGCHSERNLYHYICMV